MNQDHHRASSLAACSSPTSEEVSSNVAKSRPLFVTQAYRLWCLSCSPKVIPGTTKLHRLEENLAAADITLIEAELTQLNDLSSRVEIQGGRYPDHLEAQTNL